MYVFKGIAALCLRPGPAIEPVTYGVGQEHGLRFPAEVILVAVRWYLRFGLSYRDL